MSRLFFEGDMREQLGLSEHQWSYVRHWLVLTGVAEINMLIFNQHIVYFYLGIAALFFGGLLLRLLKVYPGEPEPLSLDSSAVAIAAGYALIAQNILHSPWRFLLILCSSAIILPHLIYIYQEK